MELPVNIEVRKTLTATFDFILLYNLLHHVSTLKQKPSLSSKNYTTTDYHTRHIPIFQLSVDEISFLQCYCCLGDRK